MVMRIDSFKEPWNGGRYVVTFHTEEHDWVSIESWCLQFNAVVRRSWVSTSTTVGAVTRIKHEQVCMVKFKEEKQLSWFLLRWA